MNKIELGDIFELITEKRKKIYLQCVEIPVDTKNEIELIKVFYDLWDDTPKDLNSIISGDYFFCRFPLKAALRKKIIVKLGKSVLPENFTPPEFYRTINFTGDCWQIVDSKTLKRRTVTILSSEEKSLSPWGMMNDTLIIDLLERGWRLETWTLDNMF